MKKNSAKKPPDGASRQAKFREEQKKLGRRGRLYYLTDAEKKAVDSFLHELRKSRYQPCRWWQERFDPYWTSDCGRAAFEFTDGGPVQNGFRFCPHCGRPLRELQESPNA